MTEKKSRKSTTTKISEIDPGNPFSALKSMEQLFDDYFNRGWFRPLPMKWPNWGASSSTDHDIPRVDIINRESEIIVRAELPGVEKQDIDITVSQNTLTIRGVTSHGENKDEGDYFHSEISRGNYQRTITLPSNIDENNAKATFRNGILTLRFPKLEGERRSKIEID